MRISLLIGAVLIAGCGRVGLRGGSSPATDAGRMPAAGPTTEPGSIRPDISDIANRRRNDASTSKTICRSSPTPSGFVIIDYISASGCVASGDSMAFNAKIVSDITRLAVGTTVRVCRDQPIPRGWFVQAHEERSDQCPARPGAAPAPTTVDIKKGG